MPNHKRFTKEEELQICKQYVEDKLNTYELAKKWRCNPTTIGCVIRRNRYNLRTKSNAHKGQISWNKIFTKEQERQICKEYFSKEEPSTVILGKEWNCNQTVIRDILIRNKYGLRNKSEAHKIFTKKEEQQICKEYFSKKKLSIIALAKKWNCSPMTISNIIVRKGFSLRTKCSLEVIQQALKNGFGTKCYYDNEFFPSLSERDCYIKLKELGFEVKHNFEGRFDFLIIKNNKKVIVEFHSYDRNGLTNKQYYNRRRKLLDKYGYKNLKLIVIKDLKEIELI